MSHCCGPKDKGLGYLNGKSREEIAHIAKERKDEIIVELRRAAWFLCEGDAAGILSGVRVGEGNTYYTFTRIAEKILYAANTMAQNKQAICDDPDVFGGIYYAALFSTYVNKIERIKDVHGGIIPKPDEKRRRPFKGMMSQNTPA